MATMPVIFGEIHFQNRNNIDVMLTVEAPVGSVIGAPLNVPAKQSVTVKPKIANCPSVLLAVEDPHGIFKQAFGIAEVHEGRPSFLETLHVEYAVASFEGVLEGRTERISEG